MFAPHSYACRRQAVFFHPRLTAWRFLDLDGDASFVCTEDSLVVCVSVWLCSTLYTPCCVTLELFCRIYPFLPCCTCARGEEADEKLFATYMYIFSFIGSNSRILYICLDPRWGVLSRGYHILQSQQPVCTTCPWLLLSTKHQKPLLEQFETHPMPDPVYTLSSQLSPIFSSFFLEKWAGQKRPLTPSRPRTQTPIIDNPQRLYRKQKTASARPSTTISHTDTDTHTQG